MPGYAGKVLRVDLSRGEVSSETPPENFYRRYVGGRALSAYYLLREVPRDIDALDPANLFILAPGVLSGAPIAGGSRTQVASLSPLTGGFGSAEGGGYWGAELKRAGWDAVVITGRAARPTWMLVEDDRVELREAGRLAGKTVAEVEAAIKEELGDDRVRVAQCGPAAERGVRYANVVFDLTHFAGRCGNGAVMASKNLRAVAVRGSKTPEIADPAGLKALARYMATTGAEKSKGFTTYGTPGVVAPLNVQGGLPTRNFREGTFEGADDIAAPKLNETLLVGRDTCFACPIHCKRVVRAEGPWPVDPVYGGPEYETIGALGSTCGVADLAAVCKGNELCAAYGLDTISTGVAIAFAMECFEEGLLGKDDTGGLELRFGSGAAMVEMVGRIARREGLGDLLAEGVARAAARLGGRAPELAMHVKGQEVPMHEPRLKHGLGLGYAVSPTGADHCHNIHDTLYTQSVTQLLPLGVLEPLPAQDLGPAKVRLFYYKSTWQHFLDSAVMCYFVPWDLGQVVDIVRAVTGWDTTLWELWKVGERAAVMARLFNLSRGLGAETDRLPDRFFRPFEDGPLAGVVFGREALERARKDYYAMAGWDESGVPTRAKLAELALDWA
ncbi:MAG: aldehyde ferredoxin oxidoreductase family protein [Bacillota bacterium]